MSATNGTGKRGRPLGSKNAPKTTQDDAAKSIIATLDPLDVDLYSTRYMSVLRAEDKARVSGADILREKTTVLAEAQNKRARAAELIAEAEKMERDVDNIAFARAEKDTAGKTQFADSGRAQLQRIAASFNFSAEQIAEIERIARDKRAEQAAKRATSEPAA